MHLLSLAAVAAASLALAAPANPDSIFDGKTTHGWKAKNAKNSKWAVGTAEIDGKHADKFFFTAGPGDLVNVEAHSSDLFTEAKFGDCTVEVEFMIPKGSNSGVYLMGEYEVQILDTYGKADADLKPGDHGGIYTFAAPKTNAGKKSGEWQKFVIDFQAPKFDGDKKVSNAKFIKVTLNGTVIHENVEAKTVTPGGLTGKEMAEGPLMFQGDHGAVSLRNIKVTARK